MNFGEPIFNKTFIDLDQVIFQNSSDQEGRKDLKSKLQFLKNIGSIPVNLEEEEKKLSQTNNISFIKDGKH